MEARDDLTQLFNRGAFDAALREAIGHAVRENQPLSLVLGDIDHFKKVNDAHGHQAGDAVLRVVAQLLERVAQGKGRVYRYGGEEIGLILRNHSVEEALAVAERVRRQIEAEAIRGIQVSMSFGVACLPDHAADLESLVRAADKALYDAKNHGRNLVRRFGEPPPVKPGPREAERKRPEHGRLTETQRAELRRPVLRGQRISCPEDGALLTVHDVTPYDSGGRQEFAVACPDCGLNEQLQSR